MQYTRLKFLFYLFISFNSNNAMFFSNYSQYDQNSEYNPDNSEYNNDSYLSTENEQKEELLFFLRSLIFFNSLQEYNKKIKTLFKNKNEQIPQMEQINSFESFLRPFIVPSNDLKKEIKNILNLFKIDEVFDLSKDNIEDFLSKEKLENTINELERDNTKAVEYKKYKNTYIVNNIQYKYLVNLLNSANDTPNAIVHTMLAQAFLNVVMMKEKQDDYSSFKNKIAGIRKDLYGKVFDAYDICRTYLYIAKTKNNFTLFQDPLFKQNLKILLQFLAFISYVNTNKLNVNKLEKFPLLKYDDMFLNPVEINDDFENIWIKSNLGVSLIPFVKDIDVIQEPINMILHHIDNDLLTEDLMENAVKLFIDKIYIYNNQPNMKYNSFFSALYYRIFRKRAFIEHENDKLYKYLPLFMEIKEEIMKIDSNTKFNIDVKKEKIKEIINKLLDLKKNTIIDKKMIDMLAEMFIMMNNMIKKYNITSLDMKKIFQAIDMQFSDKLNDPEYKPYISTNKFNNTSRLFRKIPVFLSIDDKLNFIDDKLNSTFPISTNKKEQYNEKSLFFTKSIKYINPFLETINPLITKKQTEIQIMEQEAKKRQEEERKAKELQKQKEEEEEKRQEEERKAKELEETKRKAKELEETKRKAKELQKQKEEEIRKAKELEEARIKKQEEERQKEIIKAKELEETKRKVKELEEARIKKQEEERQKEIIKAKELEETKRKAKELQKQEEERQKEIIKEKELQKQKEEEIRKAEEEEKRQKEIIKAKELQKQKEEEERKAKAKELEETKKRQEAIKQEEIRKAEEEEKRQKEIIKAKELQKQKEEERKAKELQKQKQEEETKRKAEEEKRQKEIKRQEAIRKEKELQKQKQEEEKKAKELEETKKRQEAIKQEEIRKAEEEEKRQKEIIKAKELQKQKEEEEKKAKELEETKKRQEAIKQEERNISNNSKTTFIGSETRINNPVTDYSSRINTPVIAAAPRIPTPIREPEPEIPVKRIKPKPVQPINPSNNDKTPITPVQPINPSNNDNDKTPITPVQPNNNDNNMGTKVGLTSGALAATAYAINSKLNKESSTESSEIDSEN